MMVTELQWSTSAMAQCPVVLLNNHHKLAVAGRELLNDIIQTKISAFTNTYSTFSSMSSPLAKQ